jgi:hypothetical protein
VTKGVDLKEFCDVVRESYPICGTNWLTKHYKRAQARIARKQEAQKPAAAPVEAKTKGKAKKA